MQTSSPTVAYLELLKKSLLNEIYLDDELRIHYLRDCLAGKSSFRYEVLHDIRTHLKERYQELKDARYIGRFLDRNIRNSGFNHTMIGRKRLNNLHDMLDRIISDGIAGDVIECGVWRGGACIFMNGYFKIHGQQNRRVFVADSFEGLPVPSEEFDRDLNLSKDVFPELSVSLETVKANFAQYDLLDESVVFLKGWFKDTLYTDEIETLALLRLDGDLYESTRDSLEALYSKVSAGGIIIVDDYFIPACRQALEDYFNKYDLSFPKVNKIDWGSVWWRKEQ